MSVVANLPITAVEGHYPMVKRWGIWRLVRAVFHISGRLAFDPRHGISHIILNRADPLSTRVITGLWVLLESEHIAVTLGEI
jgi:hypothetical protein